MAILDREAFITRLQERVGDDNSDSALQFIEDMTDTFNDLETRSSGTSDEQWQEKYDQLDATWREKYKARFFNSETTPDDVIEGQEKDIKDDSDKVSFDDLFTEREG